MTDQTPTIATPKPPVTSGGALSALAPQNLDDAFRLAKALSSAGDMVPKHFQGKPEATMAAIVRGMEIGLAPMQALSNIAVINGRASVWGDALPALMQRAGHSVDTVVTGDGDTMEATATLERGDTGKTTVRSFSVSDAIKAGLWKKQGPWQQYPKRMLSLRARSLACRDGAADALMGLQIAEEMRDVTPIRDVTPDAEGGWADKARAARGEVLPDTPAPEPDHDDTSDIPDAEIIPPEFDESAVFPGSPEYNEGLKSAQAALPETTNPHEAGSDDWHNWIGGYRFNSEDEA